MRAARGREKTKMTNTEATTYITPKDITPEDIAHYVLPSWTLGTKIELEELSAGDSPGLVNVDLRFIRDGEVVAHGGVVIEAETMDLGYPTIEAEASVSTALLEYLGWYGEEGGENGEDAEVRERRDGNDALDYAVTVAAQLIREAELEPAEITVRLPAGWWTYERLSSDKYYVERYEADVEEELRCAVKEALEAEYPDAKIKVHIGRSELDINVVLEDWCIALKAEDEEIVSDIERIIQRADDRVAFGDLAFDVEDYRIEDEDEDDDSEVA
jgi:hypothetical protein